MISGAHIIAGSLWCGSPGLNLVDSFVGATSDTSIFGGGSILTCSVPGISFAGTGALVLDPSTVVRSASSSVPPIIGVMPIVRPVPSLTASTFVLGVLAGGTVQAQASGLFAVVIGTAAPPQFVPFLDGALGLDLTLPIVAVAGGNVGANGSATWALALPNLPLLAGQVVGLQAIAGQSQLKLTNPIVRSLR